MNGSFEPAAAALAHCMASELAVLFAHNPPNCISSPVPGTNNDFIPSMTRALLD